MIDIKSLQRIAEGKTKVIFRDPEDEHAVLMYLKDDITAGDGLKHDVIQGKAVLDWRVNRDAFELFRNCGLPTHYISSPEERFVRVRNLQQKINVEVVSRRVATGSIIHLSDISEGTRFDPVRTEFYYKDDWLHDPKLDERYIDYLIRVKGSKEFAEMRALNTKAFSVLEAAFACQSYQLIDLKLEYGVVDGAVCIIDEVSAGSLRLWPYREPAPNLERANILDVLVPDGRLDKDIYRRGEPLSKVMAGFQKVAELTSTFQGNAMVQSVSRDSV